MNEIDRLGLLAELTHEHCELNHGPNTRCKDYPAADYIVLPLGYHEDEVIDVAVREMVIPVCHECIQALTGEEWTLCYCIECCSSQWICRQFSKFNYRHHILWLRGCPDCSNEFGGLYFNDITAVVGQPDLLGRHIAEIAA